MARQVWNNMANTMESTIIFICNLLFERVYCISVLFVSWWVISYSIHDQKLQQIKTHTHNFSFWLFQSICSLHSFITIFWSHNILWYGESEWTRPTKRQVQYYLLVIYGLNEFIVSVSPLSVGRLFHIVITIKKF